MPDFSEAQETRKGQGLTPLPFVASISEVESIVDTCLSIGAFAFDVETKGVVERHPDVLSLIEAEWKTHLATLRTKNPEVLSRSRAAIEDRWRKEIAVDPLRNEVFWIGIATRGYSWAIPMGHPNGEIITPEEVGDGTTVPPPGYRKVLASGKESEAKARYYKPATFSAPPPQLSRSEVFEALSPLFTSDNVIKIGHNVKFDARSIRKYLGGSLPSRPYMDTMLMQHIVNENLRDYSLPTLLQTNFGHNPYYRDGKIGSIIDLVSFTKACRYVHLDARWTWNVYRKLWNNLQSKPTLLNALRQDMDTIYVLMEMEDEGIPVAKRQMKTLGKDLDNRLTAILLDMQQFSPVGFNPDSVKAKGELLFGKKSQGGLGLKPTKLTPKGQPSVDDEVLESLKDKNPIVPMLLEWQELKKLKSTYVDSLLPKLHGDRLHPSFHLHRTKTGRLASSNPNLQNIPRDSEVRGLFVAPPGHMLLVFDYDQIELRVMCMFSQDKRMSEFFVREADIHAGAAALCLSKPVEDVTPEERQLGKGVNFLTAYGGGPQKLARVTGITEEHAKFVISSYYKQFSGITKWKEKEVINARRKGYVTTLSGRRRRLVDLASSDDSLRSRAERQAINAIVQGSAADICKVAMIDTYEALMDVGGRLLVQVHDELVATCPIDRVDEAVTVMLSAMGDGRVIEGIPLKVSGHAAASWSEAKGK